MSDVPSGHSRVRTMLPFVSAVLVIAAFVAGCGSDSKSDSGSSSDSSPPKIAFLAGVVDATYTPAQEAGLKKGSGGGDIRVFNPEFDPAKQLEQCQDAVATQQYDAIVITPLNNTSQIPCAKAAAAADVPLVVDANAIGPDPNELKPQEDGVVGSMLFLPITLAEYTWEGIEEACKGIDPCEAVIEVDYVGDPIFDETVKYAKEQAEGSSIQIVATYESQFDPAQTTDKLTDILVAHPSTDVVTFANDPTALAGIQVIKDAGLSGQTKAIGDGGTHNGIKAVKNGEMFATVADYPETVCAIEAEMAMQAIAGEEVAPSADAWKAGPVQGLITKANVDQVKPEW